MKKIHLLPIVLLACSNPESLREQEPPQPTYTIEQACNCLSEYTETERRAFTASEDGEPKEVTTSSILLMCEAINDSTVQYKTRVSFKDSTGVELSKRITIESASISKVGALCD